MKQTRKRVLVECRQHGRAWAAQDSDGVTDILTEFVSFNFISEKFRKLPADQSEAQCSDCLRWCKIVDIREAKA